MTPDGASIAVQRSTSRSRYADETTGGYRTPHTFSAAYRAVYGVPPTHTLRS